MPFQLSFWLTRGRGSRRTCRRSVTFGFPSLVFAVPGVRESQRQRQLAYSSLGRWLAHRSLPFPCWLRSLHCSRLSPGVVATMDRSDFSRVPSPSACAFGGRFREACSVPCGACEISLGHARFCSNHPAANHVWGFLCGASPSYAGWPTRCRRIAFTFVAG